MANATNIRVKDYRNGVTYQDWTALSTDAWTAYAGYGYNGQNWVTAIKFRVTSAATAVSFGFISWALQGGFRDLKYKITEGESSTYINATASTAGDGTVTAAEGQYERTTINATKALKANTDYVLYLWTAKTTSYESYTSIRVWNADPYPLTVTYTAGTSYQLSLTATNVTAIVALLSSPYGRTGNLANGSPVYAGEVIQVTWTVASGCTINTHTLNGETISSGDTHTVAGDVTIVLQAVAALTTISTGNGTFGTGQTLTVTRLNASYKHTIVAVCGGRSQTICTKSDTLSFNWIPDLAMMNGIPNAMSASCVLTCTTYSGDTVVGSTSITVTLALPAAEVQPQPELTVNDAAGLAPTYGGYVQGKSRAYVSVDDGLQYSASVASRSTTANGSTYPAAYFTTGPLNTAGSNTIGTTVRDSRGQSGSDSVTINVLPYAAPAISAFTVHRCDGQGNADDDGNYFNIVYTVAVAELGGHNGKTLKWRYKAVGSSTWGNWHTVAMSGYTQSGSTPAEDITTGVANGTSYDVELSLTDNFSTVVKSSQLSTVPVTIDLNEYGDGIGFGKAPAFRKSVDIGSWTAIGRVLGLGRARSAIPSGADLHTYREPGVYAITSSTIAQTLANRPTDNPGTMRVWNGLGDEYEEGRQYHITVQEYVDAYGSSWVCRCIENPVGTFTWTDWQGNGTKAELGLDRLISGHTAAANNGTMSFTLARGENGVIITSGAASAAASEIVIYNVPTGSDAVYYSKVRNATGIAVTTSGATINLKNTSGYWAFAFKLSWVYS